MNDIVVSHVDEKTVMEFLFGSETKLTEPQKKLFIQLAVKNQLDPFKREIYAIPYGDKMSVVTGYEVYLKRAGASKQLDGWKCWVEGEGDNMKAVVEIKRKDWTTPFTHEVYRSEYDSKKSLWLSKPITMLKKVAIAQAFRLAFPNELGGMIYTADEMMDAQPIESSAEIIQDDPAEALANERADMVKRVMKNLGYDTDEKRLETLRFILNLPDCTFDLSDEDYKHFYRFWAHLDKLEGVKHEKGHKRTKAEYEAIRKSIEALSVIGENPILEEVK